MSNRHPHVTIAMTSAIATTSRTCVRIPCFPRVLVISLLSSSSRHRPTLRLWDKFVACAVNRQQMFGVGGIRFQLLAELQDLVVHGASGRIRAISPHFVEEPLSCKYPLKIIGEELQ